MAINSKQYSNGGQDQKPPAKLRGAMVVLHGRHGGATAWKMMAQAKRWRDWCVLSLTTKVRSGAPTVRVAQGCAQRV